MTLFSVVSPFTDRYLSLRRAPEGFLHVNGHCLHLHVEKGMKLKEQVCRMHHHGVWGIFNLFAWGGGVIFFWMSLLLSQHMYIHDISCTLVYTINHSQIWTIDVPFAKP